MNEEELDYRLEYEKLEKKYEELQDRIDKARKYIEEMNVWCVEFENFGVESKELLEILKENDKE